MAKVVVVGGVGALAVAVLGGCGLADKQLRDEQAVPAGVTTIAVDGGGGNVSITGSSPDGSIHVKRHVRYHGKPPGTTITTAGDTLTLNTDCGRVCAVDYDVTAPAAVRV